MVIEQDQSLNLKQFNETSTSNLLNNCLNKIYSSDNLLVLDPILSPFINSLTTFSNIKEHGKCQNVTWLNDELMELPINVLSKYSSLIIILPESNENLKKLEKYIQYIQHNIHNLKYNIIVKDLSKNYLYLLNKAFNGINNFEKILGLLNPIKSVNITSKIKVFNWETDPIYTDGILLTSINQYGGLDDYFERPIKQINELSEAIVKLLFLNNGTNKPYPLLKLRNVYGKGDHSELLINTLMKSLIPNYLNENMTNIEIEYYNEKIQSNTDLIVIERNLDYFPLIFNQLNYQGIIDDLFEIKFENIVHLEKQNLTDELYIQDLKNLNFSTIGLRLNKLAKLIQQKYKDSGSIGESNLNDMKNLVSSLGNLTLQQELIKKHTIIGEAILSKVNNEYEKFLTLQNDIFEMDYKLQISNLNFFINSNYNIEFIWPTILLIGFINDGILNKDLEKISIDLQDNFGLEAALALEKLIKLKLIRVINDSSNDFLTSLGLSSQKKHHQTNVEDNQNLRGISGAKDVFKSNYTLINKFWNLHPMEDEDDSTNKSSNQESRNLIEIYPNPSFTLPGNTVPLTYRIIESLYFRDFLKYRPVNNIKHRPNWDNLGLNTMFSGSSLDLNIHNINNDKSKYMIVVFLGGITRSELTCLKYLEEKLHKKGNHKEIIIISNGIVNHHKLWQYIIQ
ncbi:VPS33 [Candida pseudojiufengensis]|uniref:VPS33 n=1 Tax=Candida pseudojiufengensis TaxID=497109 RepID=UPI00222402DB|nr:VPS33 [Candida pseudojiufengensis]KAI5964680.1 VPS33 [Candida pseudojiufengensis]